MANPGDSGMLEFWLWDRQPVDGMPPKSDDTGDFERWLWDRQHFGIYAETTVAPGIVIFRRRIEGY
jgi:hypothetical protein